MKSLPELFQSNRAWARARTDADPQFFQRLVAQQAPRYLWVGCADSRVPANEVVGMLPGELFVHRNVANVVVHTDLNCLSVVQYAVDVLKVEHIMVVGHYGCGGVQAAWFGKPLGLIDNWLRHVQDVAGRHEAFLATAPSDAWRTDRLCELNAVEQAVNLCRATVVQDAWQRGQRLTVHGWVYGLHDGLLRDLSFAPAAAGEVAAHYAAAIQAIESGATAVAQRNPK
jgi:carbonic anhydrase